MSKWVWLALLIPSLGLAASPSFVAGGRVGPFGRYRCFGGHMSFDNWRTRHMDTLVSTIMARYVAQVTSDTCFRVDVGDNMIIHVEIAPFFETRNSGADQRF